jgi:apolipoprotein N-acyltransferase
VNDASLKKLLVRNIGFWIVAAVLYPIAHWIPTASGHPPRIFDVLIPILVLTLGFVSNLLLGAGLKTGRDSGPQTANTAP